MFHNANKKLSIDILATIDVYREMACVGVIVNFTNTYNELEYIKITYVTKFEDI